MEAIATRDGEKAYFHAREEVGGYTIYEYIDKTACARPVSVTGQFVTLLHAETACIAFANARITADLCRSAYKARRADSVDGIMIYKRNHARGGNIKQWRDEQKTPHTSEETRRRAGMDWSLCG